MNETLQIKIAVSLLVLLSGCTARASNPYTPPPEKQTQEAQFLNQMLDPFLTDGTVLPETAGTLPIHWSVISGRAYIHDGILSKTEEASEYEPLILRAEFPNGTCEEYEHLLLLDPYVAYVISYFTENGNEKESLKLAFTYDGIYWYKLNEDRSILKPYTGTRRLRDPQLFRKKDGSFALIGTEGYDNPSVYLFDSPDLIDYHAERLLKVNRSTEALPMSESRAWAPEAFYDRVSNRYVLYWSSPDDRGMYYNFSDDLRSCTDPQLLYDPGYPIIDGTILKDETVFHMIFKDERTGETRLQCTKSEMNWHNFRTPGKHWSGHQSEGPMILKNLYGNGYFIVYDDYTRFRFHIAETEDFNNFKQLEPEKFLIPLEDPAHCGAIAVTWKELERLQKAYSDTIN